MENKWLPPNLKKAINKRKLCPEGAEALNWLVNVPCGDVNFKGALARADVATISAALQEIADKPKQETKKKTLEAALRRMKKQTGAATEEGAEIAKTEVIMDGENEIIVYHTKTGAPALSDREAKEFAELSRVVVEKLNFFVEVGLALQRIRDSRLYREDYDTFEDYVKDAFDLSARRSEQLRQTALAYEEIRKNFSYFETEQLEDQSQQVFVLPKNEAQVAALLRAPEDKRAEVWQMAVNKAGGKKVAARHVANVIREEGVAELGEIVEKQKREARKNGNETHKPFAEAYLAFMEQVTQAYLDDWKKVSKQDVVKRLQVIIDYVNMH